MIHSKQKGGTEKQKTGQKEQKYLDGRLNPNYISSQLNIYIKKTNCSIKRQRMSDKIF